MRWLDDHVAGSPFGYLAATLLSGTRPLVYRRSVAELLGGPASTASVTPARIPDALLQSMPALLVARRMPGADGVEVDTRPRPYVLQQHATRPESGPSEPAAQPVLDHPPRSGRPVGPAATQRDVGAPPSSPADPSAPIPKQVAGPPVGGTVQPAAQTPAEVQHRPPAPNSAADVGIPQRLPPDTPPRALRGRRPTYPAAAVPPVTTPRAVPVRDRRQGWPSAPRPEPATTNPAAVQSDPAPTRGRSARIASADRDSVQPGPPPRTASTPSAAPEPPTTESAPTGREPARPVECEPAARVVARAPEQPADRYPPVRGDVPRSRDSGAVRPAAVPPTPPAPHHSHAHVLRPQTIVGVPIRKRSTTGDATPRVRVADVSMPVRQRAEPVRPAPARLSDPEPTPPSPAVRRAGTPGIPAPAPFVRMPGVAISSAQWTGRSQRRRLKLRGLR